jgi:hypothetical protein
MDDVDFTNLAATSVLGDMIYKCPPAETCRDAFERMSKATVQMCMSTTGFGSSGQGLDSRESITEEARPAPQPNPPPSRPKPHFDMSLSDLLSTSPPHPTQPQSLPKPEPVRNQTYAPQNPELLAYPTSSTTGVPGASFQDFPSYPVADTDMGFLPGWDPELPDGFAAHGLGWESADHDFAEGGGGGLPDLFEGFFFGGAGNM